MFRKHQYSKTPLMTKSPVYKPTPNGWAITIATLKDKKEKRIGEERRKGEEKREEGKGGEG